MLAFFMKFIKTCLDPIDLKLEKKDRLTHSQQTEAELPRLPCGDPLVAGASVIQPYHSNSRLKHCAASVPSLMLLFCIQIATTVSL